MGRTPWHMPTDKLRSDLIDKWFRTIGKIRDDDKLSLVNRVNGPDPG